MPGEQSSMDENSYPASPQRKPSEQNEYDRKEAETRRRLAELKEEASRTYPGSVAPPQAVYAFRIAAHAMGYTAISDHEAALLIRAALPHLKPSGDGLDGQWLATRLEQLSEQLGKLQALVVERRTDTPGNIEREEKAFHRGVAIGRAEGEGTVLDGQLVESGPTDYEVWRDALKLAVGYANEAAESELLDVAKWFRGRLLAGPPEPSVPDCLHCGADSSMDHFEGCPKAQAPADEPLLGYQVVNPNTGEVTHGLTFAEYEAHPFKGATYPRTFPGVNPAGTGTGEWSGRAGG